MGGREVHRDAGVCVKGRIALHKHCILARVGWDGALSGECFKVYVESGFWSDDLDPRWFIEKKWGSAPLPKTEHQSHSICIHFKKHGILTGFTGC